MRRLALIPGMRSPFRPLRVLSLPVVGHDPRLAVEFEHVLQSDHRTMLAGVLWIFGTSAAWRDLPEEEFGTVAHGLRSLPAMARGRPLPTDSADAPTLTMMPPTHIAQIKVAL